jgi:hypothetical protein
MLIVDFLFYFRALASTIMVFHFYFYIFNTISVHLVWMLIVDFFFFRLLASTMGRH